MSDGEDDTFSITDAEINFAGVLALACTIPGTCICFLALVAYGIAACFSAARKQLDRVSFRLLVYTLVFNVLFGIAYAATPTSPAPGCNFGAFAVNFTLSFSTFFTTCIAINLQLVLVHGVDGQKMEKYYLIGTILLSTVLNVPTFALHQFGWDEESATCWYKNSDDHLRLRWIIGTQSFWISLAATIETVCSCVVLLWMFRFQPNPGNKTTSDGKSFWRARSGMSTFMLQDPKYRKVILRIALYPIVSLMVNYTTVVLDLNMTIRGINTQLDFRLLVLDLIMYGVRTLAYGILAFMDPAFIGAIRQIRTPERSTRATSTGRTLTSVIMPSWGGGVDTQMTQAERSTLETSDNSQQTTHSDMILSKFETTGDQPVHSMAVRDLEESRVEQTASDVTIEELRYFERQL